MDFSLPLSLAPSAFLSLPRILAGLGHRTAKPPLFVAFRYGLVAERRRGSRLQEIATISDEKGRSDERRRLVL